MKEKTATLMCLRVVKLNRERHFALLAVCGFVGCDALRALEFCVVGVAIVILRLLGQLVSALFLRRVHNDEKCRD
jgi:hypothetical protein